MSAMPTRLRAAAMARIVTVPAAGTDLQTVIQRQLPALPSTAKRDAVTVEISPADATELGFKMAREAALVKFGKGPLPIDPITGKRLTGTGRFPTTGVRSPILRASDDVPPADLEGRFRSRRERAAEIEERMHRFSAIYHAGWLLRDAYFGPTQRRQQYVMDFLAALLNELRATQDYEALIYAVADTLTASRHGVPWEP